MSVAAGSTNCTIAVGPVPATPAGYSWAVAGPTYTQPNPAAVATGATIQGAAALVLISTAAVPVWDRPVLALTLLLTLGMGLAALRRTRRR